MSEKEKKMHRCVQMFEHRVGATCVKLKGKDKETLHIWIQRTGGGYLRGQCCVRE